MHVYMCLCVCTYACTGDHGGQKRALASSELECVSHLTWVLGSRTQIFKVDQQALFTAAELPPQPPTSIPSLKQINKKLRFPAAFQDESS